MVEYATYQKVPVERKKVDPKQGTIDDGELDRIPLVPCHAPYSSRPRTKLNDLLYLILDPDYLSFLESLKPIPKMDPEALAAAAGE